MKATEALPTPVPGAKMWPLTVEAYHALGDAALIPHRTELLYGVVYHKMAKSPFHAFLVQRLTELLRGAVPRGFVLRSEQPITCVDSEPEPDLSVVRGEIEDFRFEHPRTAELVIEVCVTSLEYDRSKLRAYAMAGVKECWLVLAPEKQIEVYRRPANGEFTLRSVSEAGGRLACEAVQTFGVELDNLFDS